MHSTYVPQTMPHQTEAAPWGALLQLPHAGSATAPAFGPVLQAVLDALGLGLMLVDSAGRVQLANRCARVTCKPGALIALDGQRLTMPAADLQRLNQALRAAQRGLRSMLVVRQGGQCVSMGVVPVADDDTGPSLSALLVLGPPMAMRSLALQFFSQAHQLTPAESSVLVALSQGQRPGEIAAGGKVRVSTVRTQVAAIRHKTQSASIGHLIQQLSGLPPLAPQSLASA